jgi:uncharacterized protein YqeY
MLIEKIKSDYLQARKDNNTLAKETLSYLIGQFELEEKKVRKAPVNHIAIIRAYVNSQKENIAIVGEGSENGIKYQKEIDLLDKYIPANIAEDSIAGFIKECIISGQANKGAVMKALKEKFGDNIDMKTAAKIFDENSK